MADELKELEDQLQRGQQAMWYYYERRSAGLSDAEKITLAQETLKLGPFGIFQSMAETGRYKLRHPTKTEIELLEDRLREEPVKLMSYRRRSLGMKYERERIEAAREVLAMPSFSRARETFEHLWAKRNAAGEPGATN